MKYCKQDTPMMSQMYQQQTKFVVNKFIHQ